MTADEERISQWKRAGAAALTFNAPLGEARAEALLAELDGRRMASLVDLGCGRATLLERAVVRKTELLGVGIDSDEPTVNSARKRVEAAGLSKRLDLRTGQASSFTECAEAALCVGASHAFGGPAEMLEALIAIPHCSFAIVGDAVYSLEATEAHRSMFGELPTGCDEYAAIARAAGWKVNDMALSTLQEWDAFESAWTAGVRAIGTEEAREFADERANSYASYRGALGFAWLVLRLPS